MILKTAVLLTVVHAHRTDGSQEVIRIISARRATQQEETNMPNPCKEQLEDLIVRLNPDLSKQQAEEILALMNMREEDIDLSDIPEVLTLPAGAVRGKFYRGPMVRLTEDLRLYFCDLSRRKGVPLNDLVNETLAKAVAVAEVVK
jgi:hypothetical protein